jgi:hypothetical protein
MTSAVLGALTLSGVAVAQTTPAPVPAPSGAPAGQNATREQRFVAQFQAANTTHDGHLTLDQAKAGSMPMIVRHFSEIDLSGKGYVTMADVQAYRHARAVQRKASHGSTPG